MIMINKRMRFFSILIRVIILGNLLSNMITLFCWKVSDLEQDNSPT